MMRKIFYLLLILFVCEIVGNGCAMMEKSLPEPEQEDTIAVIGSVIIDLFEYRNITRTYRAGVDVMIAGRFKRNGKTIHKNFWTTTDDRGYFILANVPRGEYALRGFRIQTVGPSYYITVANPLKDESSTFQVMKSAKIPESAFVFKYPAMNRIINLRHNYFIIDRGTSVQHKVYFRLRDLRVITGRTIMEPSVLQYYQKKYPNSAWFQQ